MEHSIQEPTPFDRPPIAGAPLSVILLAADDNRVEEQVEAWADCLKQVGKDHEMLLILGDSEAAASPTKDILPAKYPHLRILHSNVPGLGACLRTGLPETRHPLVFYTVLNESYQPKDLAELLKWIDKVDLVCGTRLTPTGPYRKTWVERGLKFLARWFFGIRLSDPDCWFMLARRSIFARIPIQSDGQFAQVEVLAKANFLGGIMTEAPVTYRPQATSPKAWSTLLKEARLVFSHPDFGPAILPVENGL